MTPNQKQIDKHNARLPAGFRVRRLTRGLSDAVCYEVEEVATGRRITINQDTPKLAVDRALLQLQPKP